MFTYCLNGTLEGLDGITPSLWDAGCQGLEERAGPPAQVLAYFAAPLELPFAGEWLEVDQTDWLAKFRESIVPIRVGDLSIVPSWRRNEAPTDGVVIVLDPGLAFGTGQHETTRLAIAALQALPLTGARVLDVGAGSGILALVAAKLGAVALGVDNDAQTIPVAQANAAENHMNVEFIAGVLEDVLQRGPFDVVVANLFAELHDQLMAQYKAALKPGGCLLLTGILAGTERADHAERVTWDTSSGRELLVLNALKREGLELRRREQENDWVLLEASR